MELRDYKQGDEEQILELFKITFGKMLSERYWKWRFRDNPEGQHLIKLMWNDEQLVGHYAVSPLCVRLGNKKEHGALSMTTMTRPDYSGKGIFKDLADALYIDLKEKYDSVFVMGFPNNNSHYGFIKNLHWRNLGVLPHLIKETTSIKPQKSLNVHIVSEFTGIHARLLEEISRKFSVSVCKSVPYLNWRYIENPEVQYFIFEFKDGNSLKGFLVVKLYPSETRGFFNLFIVENGIPLDNMKCLPEFLSHLAFCFSPCLNEIYTWIPLFDKRHILFERSGFMPGGKPTYFGVRNLRENDAFTGDFRNWYYSYGDSDIY